MKEERRVARRIGPYAGRWAAGVGVGRGAPTAVRIGKMNREGGAGDFSENGPLERCRIAEFRILGSPEPAPAMAPGKGIAVEVRYELFDGIPLLSKWIVVRNGTDKPVRLNRFICEILAAVEPESIVDDSPTWQLPNLMVETDYTFGGMSGPNHSAGVHWVADPLYSSQVNYNRQTPCLLECRPPLGPDQVIAPGGSFESFRAFELAQDSSERERKTLALRRMYRTVSPWVTENPVLMHVRSARPDAVRQAIDQCAEVGFEMVVLTFGSGFDFESRKPEYQAQIKELADYARAKGIALGRGLPLVGVNHLEGHIFANVFANLARKRISARDASVLGYVGMMGYAAYCPSKFAIVGLTEALRKELPQIKVLVLSTHTNTEFVLRCAQSGASGYILKQASPQEFVQAIETVHAGQPFFSPEVARVALNQFVRGVASGPDPSDLTNREREVLTWIAEGLCNKEIACRLNIGTRTVETHRERLMRKLDIHSIAGLTRFAVTKGLIAA